MHHGHVTSDIVRCLYVALSGVSCTALRLPCLLPALQQRSQEARENWESALNSKDRAIAQLEEAVMQQRAALQQPGQTGDAGYQAAFGSLQMQLDQRQQQVCKPVPAGGLCTSSCVNYAGPPQGSCIAAQA